MIHVAGGLPGERVRLAGEPGPRAQVEAWLTSSPDRVPPPCILAHYCGGCVLQHQSQPANLNWKSARVAAALARAGYPTPTMRPPVVVGLRTRRRVDLAIARASEGGIALGLHRRGGDAIVDMTECLVLEPALFDLLAPLRACLRSLGCVTRVGSVLINLLDTGPDLLLRTDRPPDAGDRTRLADFGAAHRICRIAWQEERRARRTAPETLAQLAPARTLLAGRPVDIPPGAFLQAVPEAQAAITDAVIAGLPLKPRIIELYAGCGTLTFALARHGRVTAYEGDQAAADALSRAAGGQRIEVHRRDLARNPVNASEMRHATAIVLDPPYDGAGRQIEQVAVAGSDTVIIVSCNPAALRREAALLHQAGYALRSAVAIDQFLFSSHVEAVVVFKRENSRRTRSGPSR